MRTNEQMYPLAICVVSQKNIKKYDKEMLHQLKQAYCRSAQAMWDIAGDRGMEALSVEKAAEYEASHWRKTSTLELKAMIMRMAVEYNHFLGRCAYGEAGAIRFW